MQRQQPSKKELKCFSQWLGIPAEECPPNHYQLLGLPLYTDQVEQIQTATEERMLLIDQCVDRNSSEDIADGNMLRRYVDQVSAGLLDAQSKTEYDRELRTLLDVPHFLANESPVSSARPTAPDTEQSRQKTEPHTRQNMDRSPAPSSTPTVHEPHKQNTPAATATAESTAATDSVSAESARSSPTASRASMSTGAWIAIAVFANVVVLSGIAAILLNRQPTEVAAVKLGVGDEVSKKEPNNVAKLEEPSQEEVVPIQNESLDVDTDAGSVSETPQQAKQSKTADQGHHEEPIGLPVEPVQEPVEKTPPTANPIPTNPFEDLEDEWALLDPLESKSESQRSVMAGTIAKPFLKELQLELDQGVADIEDGYHLETRQLKEEDRARFHWGVYLKSSSGAGGDVPQSLRGQIARFFIDLEGRLRFQWTNNFPFNFAAQLANAVLILRVQDHLHSIHLRVPYHAEQFAFDFSETGGSPRAYQTQALIKAMPNQKIVLLEVPDFSHAFDHVEYLPMSRRVPLGEPEGKAEEGHVILGETRQVELQFQLIRSEDDPSRTNLQMRVFYFLHKDSKVPTRGKVPSYGRSLLTWKKLNKEIIGYRSSIRKKYQDLKVAINRYRSAEDALANARRMSEDDVHQVRLKERAIQRAQQAMKKHRKSVNLILKQLPNSYRVLTDLYRVRALALQLHNLGPLTLSVYAERDEHRVTLAVADNQPQHVPPLIPIPKDMSVAGSWINPSAGVIFELGAGGTAQATELSTQRSATGNWSEQGKQVTINVGGINNYNRFEEVVLKGLNGSNLYRIF